MENFPLILTLIGLIGLSMSWIPSIFRRIGISYSIFYVAIGLLAYGLFSNSLPWPNPYREQEFTTHITEIMVIIALMSTGLRIDRKLKLSTWRAPLLLVSVLMLLSIGALALMGYAILGWSLGTALLLGAVMAPTDPVLAADVQVGPPKSETDHDVKFALTAEAGMNDGMAFPFTYLAIAVTVAASSDQAWFWDWVAIDLLFRVIVGGLCGYLMGRVISYVFFKLPRDLDMKHVRDGLVALSGTLAVYGITELLEGYGFIAVFVAAVTLRNHEKGHEYHKRLHEFIDQIERMFLGILLLLFGGSLYSGILKPLTWDMALVGIVFIFMVRPLASLVSLAGVPLKMSEKLAIGFFGIKGIGSFYYLAYALGKADFAHEKELWALASFIVLVSIIIHGITVIPVMTLKRFSGPAH